MFSIQGRIAENKELNIAQPNRTLDDRLPKKVGQHTPIGQRSIGRSRNRGEVDVFSLCEGDSPFP